MCVPACVLFSTSSNGRYNIFVLFHKECSMGSAAKLSNSNTPEDYGERLQNCNEWDTDISIFFTDRCSLTSWNPFIPKYNTSIKVNFLNYTTHYLRACNVVFPLVALQQIIHILCIHIMHTYDVYIIYNEYINIYNYTFIFTIIVYITIIIKW